MKNKFFKLLLNTIPILVILGCSNKGDYSSTFLSSSLDNSSLLLDGSFESPSFSSSSFGASTTSQKGTNLSNNDSSVIISSQIIGESSHISSQSSQTSSEGSQFSNQENELPPEFIWIYDEYYCLNDQSLIKLCENGYFKYEKGDDSFSSRYYVVEDLIIVNYSIIEMTESSYSSLVFPIIFKVYDKTLVCDTSFYSCKQAFDIFGKQYDLVRENVDENIAKYHYSRKDSRRLIASLTLSSIHQTTNVEEVLNYLDMLSLKDNITYFYISPYGNVQVKFSFDLESTNAYDVLSLMTSKESYDIFKSLSFSIDNETCVGTPILKTYGLNESNKINDFIYLELIRNSTNPFQENECENGLCLTSYLNAVEYAELLSHHDNAYGKVINLISSISESDFNDYNLVLSNMVTESASNIKFVFKDVYLSEETLYIVLDREEEIGGGAQVLSFDTCAFLISKNISFKTIRTI